MEDMFSFGFADHDANLLPDTLDFGIDWNRDGFADLSLSLSDTVGSLAPDSFKVAYDWDSDGVNNAGVDIDLTASKLTNAEITGWMDYNNDGAADLAASGLDLNYDFVPDIPSGLEVAENVWGDIGHVVETIVSDILFEGESPRFGGLESPGEGFQEYWQTHGTPEADLLLFDQQDGPVSCAVATSNMMFRSLGIDVGESALAEVMVDSGAYDPFSGTMVSMLADVLNDVCEGAGLDHQATDLDWSSPDSLAALLDQGTRPLLAIDAVELHQPEDALLNKLGLIPDSGHAVQLIGIESGPEGDIAILNDPAMGPGVKVPMDRLISAGDDYDFQGVALV